MSDFNWIGESETYKVGGDGLVRDYDAEEAAMVLSEQQRQEGFHVVDGEIVGRRTRWQWKDGKTYERELLEPLRLDAPTGDKDGDTLGSTLTAGGSDDETDLVPRGDLALHVAADLHAVRDLELIQAAAPREAPRRAPGPRTLMPRKAELETSAGLRQLYPDRTAQLKLEPSEVTSDESS